MLFQRRVNSERSSAQTVPSRRNTDVAERHTACWRVVCGPTWRPAGAAPGRSTATVRQEVLRISCERFTTAMPSSARRTPIRAHTHTHTHTLPLLNLIYCLTHLRYAYVRSTQYCIWQSTRKTITIIPGDRLAQFCWRQSFYENRKIPQKSKCMC